MDSETGLSGLSRRLFHPLDLLDASDALTLIARLREQWPSPDEGDVYNPAARVREVWAAMAKVPGVILPICPTLPDCDLVTRLRSNIEDEGILWQEFYNALTTAQRAVEAATQISKGDEQGKPAHQPKNPKRSTESGEARVKIIAALTKHHEYADDSCLNFEPIGNNELARLAGVSESTASAFFKKEFESHAKYRVCCLDKTQLITSLKVLNQEFSPHILFGRNPPGEDERGDDE